MRTLSAICLSLVVLMGLMSASHALSSGDAEAMEEMRRHFSLFNAPLGATNNNPDGMTSAAGGAWPASVDPSYTLSYGCDFYGLCTYGGPNVDQLYIDVVWARAAGLASQSDWNATALAQLTFVTTIGYTIPSDPADEAILAPFIYALLNALPASQIASLTVIGVPTVTTYNGESIYDPVWSWTALTSLELFLTPSVTLASEALLTLKIAATDLSNIPSGSRGTITTLTLAHPTLGTTNVEGMSNAFTALTTLSLYLRPALNSWTLNAPTSLTALTVTALSTASFDGGSISLNGMDNVQQLVLENLVGEGLTSITVDTASQLLAITMNNVSAHSARLLFCTSGNTLSPSTLLAIVISTSNGEVVDLVNDVCLSRVVYTALTRLVVPFSWTPFIEETNTYEDVFPHSLRILEVSDSVAVSHIDFTGFSNEAGSLLSLTLYGSSLSNFQTTDELKDVLTNTWLSLTTLTIYGNANGRLTGTLDSQFFASFTSSPVAIILSGHSLTGTIPSAGILKISSLDLSHNQFTAMEALQPGDVALGSKSFAMTQLDVSYNSLTNMLSDANLQCFSGLSGLWVHNNPSLSMVMPTFIAYSSNSLNTFVGSNTSLNGSLPSALSVKLKVLDVSHTLAEGPLVPFSTSNGLPNYAYNYSFHGNPSMNGAIPTSWSSVAFAKFDVGATSVTHSGTSLPFTSTPLVKTYIDISGTSLSGDVWEFTNLRSGVLLADNLANVNFCPTASSLPSYYVKPTLCSIDEAALCSHTPSSTCVSTWFALGCLSSSTPCSTTQPTASPTTTTPPTAPTAPTAAPVVQCPLPAPSSSFTCVNGKYVSNSSVTASQLTLPNSAGAVVVAGNLTVGSVTFNGLGSSLVIQGCVKYLPVVYVSLSDDDIAEIRKSGNKKSVTLASIASNSSCANSTILSATQIVLSTNSTTTRSCRTVTANKSTTSGNSLVATFTIDNSKCDRWWVILVTVICSVFIVVVLIIVVVKFVPACQVIVRPFKGTGARI